MIIYGKNPLKEAILNKRNVYNVYLDTKLKDLEFIEFLNSNNISFKKTNKEELFKLTNTTNHQGIVAEVKDYEYISIDELLKLPKPLRIIALDQLTDPHNLGAIIRSSEAFSMSCILISNKNQVLINPTVVKVSAGAIEKVKVCLVNNLNNAILKLRENNILVYGTSLNTNTSYKEIKKDKDVCVVLGNEGVGVRKLVLKNCDYLVKIPMTGKINSLNVSVAGAIIMNELQH